MNSEVRKMIKARKIFVLITILAVVPMINATADAAGVLDKLLNKTAEYESFSVELPNGWTAEKDPSPGQESVTFTSKSGFAAVSVTVFPSLALESRAFAEAVSKDAGGDRVKDNGDGLYRFDIVTDGVTARTLVGVLEGRGVVITVAGDDPDLPSIAASIKIKLDFRPDVRKLF
jgi:hypothetical protein